MAASVGLAAPAYAASTLGLDKDVSVDAASPGEDFTYTLIPRCSGLTESCINAVLTDVVPDTVEITALPTSTPDYAVAFDAGSRTLTVTFLIPLPAPSPAGSVGLPAGSSRNIELGVKIPDNSQTPDGTVITNTGALAADNAPPVTDPAEVTVDVPRVVAPVATKSWSDGSAVAHSGETGTITLGARNGSSSTAQVSELTIEDSTPAVFEHFDVTGVGPVTFPAGADQVTVLACTVPLSVCADSDYLATAPQTGPSLTLPVDAADVTGLRFLFSSASNAVLPFDPTGGSVQIATVLRDTVRSTGADYSPTVREDIANCVTPTAVDPVQGTVSAVQACSTYSVQPAQATIAMAKSYFSDTNGDYSADGQAVIGLNSLVSGLVSSTNTSPFPVSTMTITEPSATSPSEFSKLDLTRSRIVFPAGATAAELVIRCDDTDSRTLQFTAPPATVDIPTPCPSGTAAGITVTFTGTNADGDGTIGQNAVATLGIQGRLNDQVTDDDVNDGGVSNCADGTATSTGNGIGSASGSACATVPVQPAFARLNGVKSSQLPTILPGLPRRFDLSFKNNGTIPATGVVLADPADPTATPNIFDSIRLSSLTLPASPAANAQLFDPTVTDYVPYDAADADLIARATGFRVIVPSVDPGQSYALNAQVLLRDGVDVNTTLQNCAAIGSDTQQPPTQFCAPRITVLAQSAGAAVQKSIAPAQSVRPRPGLPGQNIQVKFATQNTGTLWLKRLVVQDVDTAFFDTVDIRSTDPIRVNFPPSANRVQVDACTGACGEADFVNGRPTASQSPALPIPATDVRGVRVTFLTADGSFTIRPGTNFPATGLCAGASICLNVSPRGELRSAPGTPVPTELRDTATGGYETTQQGGVLAPIPETSATHTLTDGSASLRFAKASDISVSPGTPIPVTLTATNTGTGAIPDLQVVDPIPAQLEFSPNDPAVPYTVNYTLPAGAPEPAEVVFTPISDDTGKVTSIRLQFPGWDMVPGTVVAVTIQLKLAPGNTAGAVIENRAGATGDRPDLTCAAGGPRPGTAVDDPTYGDGTFCTSAAQVTTLAGNAFRTEKWVAGDVGLGWLNSLTNELVPLEDPNCPRLDVDGQLFTRYPCVARVAPGQGFDFYLRLTNAGTNPATEVRLVDVFPAPGDTGVILTGEQRGTEWEQAPTLLGPVSVVGPGELFASYSTANPVCTSDLNRPPADCAATDWDLGYDPRATAFRGIVTFPGQLAPGASSALRFRMAAPAAPTNPEQNEIAWNSFAHTEFFQEPGRIVQLPPTEPIKTGVALVYGGLSITKTVVGEPVAEQAGPYGFQYECSVTPELASGGPAADPVVAASGTLELAAGETRAIATVPARADCLVWEPDSDGLLSDAADRDSAKTVVIPVAGSADQPADVTITNTVPLIEPTAPTQPTDPTETTEATETTETTEPTNTGAPTDTTLPTETTQATAPVTTTGTVTIYAGQNGSGYAADGSSTGSTANLSYTGVDVGGLVRVALCLLLAGAFALQVTRLSRRWYRGTH